MLALNEHQKEIKLEIEREKVLKEMPVSYEEKEIAYRAQLYFYKEYQNKPVELLQKIISLAEKSEDYRSYTKVEKNYLALNRFRLFLAKNIIEADIAMAPVQQYRRLAGHLPPPPSPEVKPISMAEVPSIQWATPMVPLHKA
jgi:hypothetical protein